MNEEIRNVPIGGVIHNYYPFVIEDLLTYQTIKDGQPCSIFFLYGKEVSIEELKEFLEKHKP